MKYIIYKTINAKNGKFYIGVHQTLDLDDDYLGSGYILKCAIKKYGKKSFKREILYVFTELNDALDKEREIVNEEFIRDCMTYNIALGGGMGGKNINGLTFEGRTHTDESKRKMSKALSGRKLSKEHVEKIIYNNIHNEERKKNISNTLSDRTLSDGHKLNIKKSIIEYYKNNPTSATGRNTGPKPKIKCPYCDKCGSANNMKRWHFDNCKH